MQTDHSPQLAQLADIHTAAPPALWPPAPGWWLLALFVLVIVTILIRVAMGKAAIRRRRQAWLDELDSLGDRHDPESSPHDYLAALNRLFRGVALKAFPDTACAKLEGEAWVAFLAGLMPEGVDTDDLAILARGPYEPAPNFDAPALQSLATAWVNRYG